MNFEQTSEFKKELKAFAKKWRSLPDDLDEFLKVIATLYLGGDSLPPERIRETFFASKKAAVLQAVSENKEVVKARLDCASLNKDMLRITYIRSEGIVLLVELYSKNDKNREDKNRIKKYL